MKILFVDDEQPILDMVSEYFSSKDYSVFVAHNGEEALEILKNQRIDCCFTDLNMPGMDGMELTRQVQKLDNTIPMVVMTGYPSLEGALGTLRSGVVDFLIKPIQLRQMEIVMQTATRRREALAENIMLKKALRNRKQIERLHNQLTEKVQDVGMLNHIIKSLEAASSVREVFDRAVSLTLEVSGADAAFFFIVGDREQGPVCVLSQARDPREGAKQDQAQGGVVEMSRIVKWVSVLEPGAPPFLFPNSRQDVPLPSGVGALAAAPVSMNERPFGQIVAVNVQGGREISQKALSHMVFMAEKAGMAVENFGLYENIYENMFATLFAFVETLEARDAYTRQHSVRVTRIAELLAGRMGCTDVDMEILQVAGNLHDIGKIGIPDSILLKPGRLTDEEFDVIKRHPDIGANIVGYMGLWDREKEIIRHHHEKFDGSGYPQGLAGEDIPRLSRVLAVADVYDAVTTDRAYRKRLPEEVCRKIIREGSGRHFDPRVVDAFFQLYDERVIQEALVSLTPSPSPEDAPDA